MSAKSYAKAKEEMEEHFNVIAREIGPDWKWLGRELKLTHGDAEIENIDADNPNVKEKAYQVLVKWYEENGRSCATKEKLCEALHEIKKKSLAERICCCGTCNIDKILAKC